MLTLHHKAPQLCFHASIWFYGLHCLHSNLSFQSYCRSLNYMENDELNHAYTIWCLEAGYYDLAE